MLKNPTNQNEEEKLVLQGLSPKSLLLSSPESVYISYPLAIKSCFGIEKNLLNDLVELHSILSGSTLNSTILLDKCCSDRIKRPEEYDFIDQFLKLYFTKLSHYKETKAEEKSTLTSSSEGTLKNEVKTLKKCFRLLLEANTVMSKAHYQKLYELVAIDCAYCVSSAELYGKFHKILTLIKILSITSACFFDQIAKQVPSFNQRKNFFFLPTNSILNTQIPGSTEWPFCKGFSFITWFKQDSSLPILTPQTVFRLKSSSRVIECYLSNREIYYKVSHENIKSKDDIQKIVLGKLADNKYQFIAISHEKCMKFSKINYFIDTAYNCCECEYPLFSPDELLLECAFFENFAGLSSSILLYNIPLKPANLKLINDKLPYGICENNLKLEDLGQIPKDQLFLAFSPIRSEKDIVYSMNASGKCLNAVLKGNCGVISKPSTRNRTSYLDPIKNIIPFFYLASLCPNAQASVIFQKSLKLSSVYLSNLEHYLKNTLRYNKECLLFSRMVSYHISNMDPSLMSRDIVQILKNEILICNSYVQFYVIDLIFLKNFTFWLNTNLVIQEDIWGILKTNYSLDPIKYQKIINIPSIIKIMDSMADSLKDGYCCEEEYKERNSKITTEGCNLLGENLHNKEEKKETIHFFQLNVRYAPIEVFIKYLILMENDQKADMNIKYIVNCLSSKPKHCLFISLVSLLKEVILWDPRHLKSFDQYDGLHIIFTALLDSPYFDLKIVCLQLAAYVTNQARMNKISLKNKLKDIVRLIYWNIKDILKGGKDKKGILRKVKPEEEKRTRKYSEMISPNDEYNSPEKTKLEMKSMMVMPREGSEKKDSSGIYKQQWMKKRAKSQEVNGARSKKGSGIFRLSGSHTKEGKKALKNEQLEKKKEPEKMLPPKTLAEIQCETIYKLIYSWMIGMEDPVKLVWPSSLSTEKLELASKNIDDTTVNTTATGVATAQKLLKPDEAQNRVIVNPELILILIKVLSATTVECPPIHILKDIYFITNTPEKNLLNNILSPFSNSQIGANIHTLAPLNSSLLTLLFHEDFMQSSISTITQYYLNLLLCSDSEKSKLISTFLLSYINLISQIILAGLQTQAGMAKVLRAINCSIYCSQYQISEYNMSISSGAIADVAYPALCLKFLWNTVLKLFYPTISISAKITAEGVWQNVILMTETIFNLIISEKYTKNVHHYNNTVPHLQICCDDPHSSTETDELLNKIKISDINLINTWFDFVFFLYKEYVHNFEYLLTVKNYHSCNDYINEICKNTKEIAEHILLMSYAHKDITVNEPSCFGMIIMNYCLVVVKSIPEGCGLEEIYSRWIKNIEQVIKYFLILSTSGAYKNDKRFCKHCESALLIYFSVFLNEAKYRNDMLQKKIYMSLGESLKSLCFLCQIPSNEKNLLSFYNKHFSCGSPNPMPIIPLDKLTTYLDMSPDDIGKLVKDKSNLLLAEHSIFVKETHKLNYRFYENIQNSYKKFGVTMAEYKSAMKKNREKADKLIQDIHNASIKKYYAQMREDEIEQIYQKEIENHYNITKWHKIQKQIKGWQGEWKISKALLSNSGSLSNHHFANYARCLMKLRRHHYKFLDLSQIAMLNKKFSNHLPDNYYLASYQTIALPSLRFNPIDKLSQSAYLVKAYFFQEARQIAFSAGYAASISLYLLRMLESSLRSLAPPPLDCEIYTGFLVKKGKVLLILQKTAGYILFVLSKVVTKDKEDKRLMFTHDTMQEKWIIKKWPLNDIRSIIKKQMVEAKTAMEIAFYSGKVVLLNFNSESDRELFSEKIIKIKDKYLSNLKYSGGYFDSAKAFAKSKLTEDWVNWRISTFDLLMGINYYSSRSFFNYSQYPVFPWLIKECASDTILINNKNIYRDLTKNVGMAGDPERASFYIERYSNDIAAELGKFHFGSHYSSPGIVFEYLMRICPFFEIYVKFFAGFDDPNRMFHSICEGYISACKDRSNVRELIPEFFCFPDMLINKQEIAFGEREDDKVKVNHVLLPKWSHEMSSHNPLTIYHSFTTILRTALESDYVSSLITNWIDLLFGYKQRGKEAEKANNIFHPLCYEPGKILSSLSGEEKDALRLQAYHWGQVPQQLFSKKLVDRKPKKPDLPYNLCDANVNIRILNCNSVITKKSSEDLWSTPQAKKMTLSTLAEEGNKPKCFSPSEANIGEKKRKALRKHGKVNPESIIKISFYNDGDEKLSLVSFGGLLLEGLILDPGKSEKAGGKSHNISCTHSEYRNQYTLNIGDWLRVDPSFEYNFPITFVRKHKIPHMAQGGYINGGFLLLMLNVKEIKTKWVEANFGTITNIESDKEGRIGIVGTKTGECLIYCIEDNALEWTQKRHLIDHSSAITYIHISDSMQLFVTSSLDGSANMYNLSYKPKIIRTFLHPNLCPIHYSLLAQNPLPVIVIFSKDDQMIYCYSINGDLIKGDRETTENIISPGICHDSNFCDYLVYARDQDSIIRFRKLPNLEKNPLANLKKVSAMAISESGKYMVVGFRDGSFSLITEASNNIIGVN